MCWWFNAGVTPVLIPNTEVKPRSADGTRKGRVGSRQNRVLNFLFYKKYFYSGLGYVLQKSLLSPETIFSLELQEFSPYIPRR